jgi:5-methylcytosine-specific restriction endonuclease McrA
MKRKPKETMAHWRHRIFMQRTAAIYDSHKRHLNPGGYLDYDLEKIRRAVSFALKKQKLCPWCGDPLSVRTFQFDHKLSISRGGRRQWRNLQLICVRCNELKGSLSPGAFQRLLTIRLQFPNDWPDLSRRLRAGGKALTSFVFKYHAKT